MIEQNIIDAFNARPKVDLNNIKTLGPAEADKVKAWGTQAENLLSNREFAMFVHQFKFEMTDLLAEFKGHTAEDDRARVAIAHNLAGVDAFVSMLKRAKYFKDKVVSIQTAQVQKEDTPNL